MNTHEFVPYPGGRYPISCVRCGRVRSHPIHQPPFDQRLSDAAGAGHVERSESSAIL
jgi:hypothetical protein